MEEKKFLKGDQILAIKDIQTVDVQMPEWENSWIRLQTPRAIDFERYQKSIMTGKGKNRDIELVNARAKLIAMLAIDPVTGQRLFSDSQMIALGQKSSKALERLFDKASELAGIDEEKLEEMVDALKDNPLGDSPTA